MTEINRPAAMSDAKYDRIIGGIERCTALLQTTPNDCRCYYVRAKSWEALGIHDQALADYRRLQQIDGDYASRREVSAKIETIVRIITGSPSQNLLLC